MGPKPQIWLKCGLLLILATMLTFVEPIPTNDDSELTGLTMNEMLNIERHLREEREQIDKYEKTGGEKYFRLPACALDQESYLGILFRKWYRENIRDAAIKLSQDYDNLHSYPGFIGGSEFLNDFAKQQSSRSYSSSSFNFNFHIIFYDTDSFIGKLASANQLQANITCRASQSPQQFLYIFYMQSLLYEAKEYALIKWSYMWLTKSNRRNYTYFEEDAKSDHERRLDRIQSVMKDLIVTADRTVWSCDPKEHQPHVTYEMVTRLLQGFVANEENLSTKGTCFNECADYKSTKFEGRSEIFSYARNAGCVGKVYDCRFVESDMKLCESDYNSDRRYEYIQFESGLVYGQTGSFRSVTNVESWHRWIFWRCSYCLCLCDDISDNSDRFFSLRPVVADVERNRVVTGLRFVKHNRILHLQIQEGKLLPQGVIQSNVDWKPVDQFEVSDEDVKKDVDFHMLKYEKRSIDLDEVKVENKFVVTGLRFRVVGTHLNLEAQFSEFDFESGQLIEPTENSFWKSGGSDQPRKKLHLKNPNVATRSNSSVPLSTDNQYIEFTNTGFKEDAAQSTVPFIDIQDVTSDPPVPLSGIGIYYKGLDSFGGFLGPKLITYDFSPHIKVPIWAIQHSPDTKSSL